MLGEDSLRIKRTAYRESSDSSALGKKDYRRILGDGVEGVSQIGAVDVPSRRAEE